MAEPSKLSSRRWLVPQFSLRALLFVVTLSAIGTAIWYRWPIEEETDLYAQLSPAAKKRMTPQKMRATREVKTYRRVWGGQRVLHGWTRRYHANGQLVFEELWREGVRHGPLREWSNDGILITAGSFFNGKRDGLWQIYGTAQSWERGTPVGVWELRDDWGAFRGPIEFRNGAIARINNRPFEDRLMTKAIAGAIDDKRIQAALTEGGTTDLEFVETPLKDVITYLRDATGLPIRLDCRSLEESGISVDHPITQGTADVPYAVALTMIAHPLGLAADYRFGCIFISPAADAENWRDRTGVSEIKPRPDSALARHWERPVTFDFVETGLTDVMRYITDLSGVPIDVSVEKPFEQTPITTSLKGLSLKNSLGILCEGWLHVRQDGDRLAIELLELPDTESAQP